MLALILQMGPSGGFFLFFGMIVSLPAYLTTFLGAHMFFASLAKSNNPTTVVRLAVHAMSIAVVAAIITIACLLNRNALLTD